jgi:hypothetical protein
MRVGFPMLFISDELAGCCIIVFSSLTALLFLYLPEHLCQGCSSRCVQGHLRKLTCTSSCTCTWKSMSAQTPPSYVWSTAEVATMSEIVAGATRDSRNLRGPDLYLQQPGTYVRTKEHKEKERVTKAHNKCVHKRLARTANWITSWITFAAITSSIRLHSPHSSSNRDEACM